MATLIEKLCKTPIKINYPSGTIVDGKPAYTEVPALARVSDFSQVDIDYFGRINNGKVFLIAPLSTPPPPNGQIIYNSKTYDIKSVKVIANIKNQILGYKCAISF